MSASAFATGSPENVVSFCKYPIAAFNIIVYVFDEHFFLDREYMLFRQSNCLSDTGKAVFT